MTVVDVLGALELFGEGVTMPEKSTDNGHRETRRLDACSSDDPALPESEAKRIRAALEALDALGLKVEAFYEKAKEISTQQWYKYGRKLPKDELDDVVHESLLKWLKNLNPDMHEKFNGFLYRIVSNVVVTRGSRGRSRHEFVMAEPETLFLDEETECQLALIERDELSHRLHELMSRWAELPTKDWSAITYSYLCWFRDIQHEDATKDPNIAQFIQTVLRMKGTGQTIRRHIANGVRQLSRWLLGDDPWPLPR